LSIVFTHPPPCNVTINTGEGQAEWVEAIQRTGINEYLSPEITSVSSSVTTQHEEARKNYQSDDIHTSVHKIPLLGRDFVKPIVPSVTANFRELVL
jgi:hypothetical protein